MAKRLHHALFRYEFAGIARLSVPITLALVLELGPPIVTSMMIGKVGGQQVIAAGTLSDFFQGIVSINITIGLGTAISTVCSHAFGAKHYEQYWLLAQAGMLGCAYSAVPITVLSLTATPILTSLGQDPELARIAGTFILLALGALPFSSFYTVARSVLQAQNVAMPCVFVSVVASAIGLSLGYVLGNHASLGYVGVALSVVISSVVKAVAIVPVLLRNQLYAAAWPGWQWRQAHRLVCDLWRIGTGSILMATFQSSGFMAVSILCGYLPNSSLLMAASGIGGSFITIAFLPLMGISTAGTVRMGNALGAGLPVRASAASVMMMGIMIIASFFGILVCGTLARQYASAYTSDSATIDLVGRLVRHLLPFIPIAAVVMAGQAVFQACNAQWLCSLLNFVFLFVATVGVAVLMAIPLNGGLMGLWDGPIIGSVGSIVASAVWYKRLDWNQKADGASRHEGQLRVSRAESTDLSPHASFITCGSGSIVFLRLSGSSSTSDLSNV